MDRAASGPPFSHPKPQEIARFGVQRGEGGLPRSRVSRVSGGADACFTMDAAERKDILNRYLARSRQFDEVAARRESAGQSAEVIQFTPPMRELEQEPTMREIEVLQLISEGLVNREIGQRLFLSEETVKSHVRHLLAKLQARSRAHAVAIGFRRGLVA